MSQTAPASPSTPPTPPGSSPTTAGTARRQGLSGGDKWLIGCGLGCAALVVMLLVAVALGFLWAVEPGRQHPTSVAVDPASHTVVRLHDLGTDPGARALVAHVVTGLQELDRRDKREQLPESMGWLVDMQQSGDASGFEMFLPREATLAFAPRADDDEDAVDGGTDDAWTLAANPRALARPFALLWNLLSDDARHRAEPYRGHEILRMPDLWSTFADSTFLVSNDLPALRSTLDRLEAETPVAVEVASPEGEWDAEGEVGNRGAQLARFLEQMPVGELEDAEIAPPAPYDDLALGFGVDVLGVDSLRGRLVLHCRDVPAAIGWLAFLEPRFAYLREDARREGLVFDTRPRAEGAAVEIPFELSGLEAKLDEWLDSLAETETGSTPPGPAKPENRLPVEAAPPTP